MAWLRPKVRRALLQDGHQAVNLYALTVHRLPNSLRLRRGSGTVSQPSVERGASDIDDASDHDSADDEPVSAGGEDDRVARDDRDSGSNKAAAVADSDAHSDSGSGSGSDDDDSLGRKPLQTWWYLGILSAGRSLSHNRFIVYARGAEYYFQAPVRALGALAAFRQHARAVEARELPPQGHVHDSKLCAACKSKGSDVGLVRETDETGDDEDEDGDESS